ncbi:hypothetical protein ACFWVP_10590 [Streptomyces sp. NPDC058637]|uniref:hypothetical protein n=1 Tax=Streptomyces sp. NPDC058637 TaxID=3346569 RepID=UPI00365ECA6A
MPFISSGLDQGGVLSQLQEHWPEASAGVTTTLDFWRHQGGYLNYGRHEETSCFPVLDAGTSTHPHLIWPLGLYPVSGTVEVVADRRVLFLGSANLTESAARRAIEAGVLVRGGDAPRRAAEHVEELQRRGVLQPLRA